MNKKMLIPILILGLLITQLANNVYAFSYINFSVSPTTYDSYCYPTPTTQNIVHSSGRYIYILPLATTIMVYITESDGSAGSTITINNLGSYVKAIELIEYNSTFVLITGLVLAATYNEKAFAVLVNIVSHVFTTYLSSVIGATSVYSTSKGYGGFIALYANNYYFVNQLTEPTGTPADWIIVSKFDAITHVITNTATSMGAYGYASFILGNGINSTYQYGYFMTAYNSSSVLTQPKYYEVNFVTREITLLAIDGSSGIFGNSRNIRFLGAGIQYNGSYTYVYYTWVYPFVAGGNLRQFKLIQNRLVYSNFSAKTLYTQNKRYVNIQPSQLLGSVELPVLGTYLADYQSGQIIIAAYDSGVLSSQGHNFTVLDWFSTSRYDIDSEDQGYTDTPINSISEIIVRSPISQFSSNELVSGSYLRVYYGLPSYVKTYSLSVSYLPSDDPLVQNTRYLFSTQLYLNGIPITANQKLYINSVDKGTRASPNGYNELPITFIQSGINNVTYVYYVGTEIVYQQTFSYLVIDEGAIPPNIYNPTPQLATVWTLLNNIGLIFLLLGTPVFMGILMYEAHKPDMIPLGIVTGLALGGIIGLISGLLPAWGFILICVCVVGYVVVMTRSSGGVKL